jgi:hypothetical protein
MVRLRIKASQFRYFTYAGVSVLCAMGTVFLFAIIFDIVPLEDASDKTPLIIFITLWNSFSYWLSYYFVSLPTSFTITEGDKIIIKSPLYTLSLNAKNITKIDSDDEGDWRLYYSDKKLDLRYFCSEDLSNVLGYLLQKNNSIKVDDFLLKEIPSKENKHNK